MASLLSSRNVFPRLIRRSLTTFPRRHGIAKLEVVRDIEGCSSSSNTTTVHLLSTQKSDESASILEQDFKGKAGEVQVRYPQDEPRHRNVFVGVGDTNTITTEGLRQAAHSGISAIRKLGSAKVCTIVAPEWDDAGAAVATGALLSNYRFDKYLTTAAALEGNGNALLDRICIKVETQDAEDALKKADIITQGTIFSRDLMNERADVANPALFETLAREIAKEENMSVEVLQMDELQANGLNLLAAVGQAAKPEHSPRLIALRYNGNPSAKNDKIALVGKGVTFDTGGLNLKPTGFIEDMHLDMGGAACVLSTMQTIARLKLKVNVVGVLALAENAIDADSYKPHAIITSMKGLTVEVNNTDAEGRLALADALTWVQQNEKPHTVVDFATLTGACVVALGEYCAGCFSNDDALSGELRQAGAASHERVWPMPILDEHEKELRSGAFSDLRSTGKGREGGACTAAAFLKAFIEDDVKWAHVDIAGPAMFSADRGYVPKGGTGFGVGLVCKWLEGCQNE